MSSIQAIDWFRWFEAVGVWAAAFATLVAASMALRIARRQDEIRLQVSAAAGHLVGAGPTQDIVWIRIINLARRTATVSGVGWKLSSLNKFELYQTLDHPNPTPPFELKDGEMVSLSWPVITGDANWYDGFAERLTEFGRLRRLFELHAFKLKVSCTTGEEFEARPSKEFMNHVREAISRKEAGDMRG